MTIQDTVAVMGNFSENFIMKQRTGQLNFIIDITEKGIESITVQSENKKTQLKQCTE